MQNCCVIHGNNNKTANVNTCFHQTCGLYDYTMTSIWQIKPIEKLMLLFQSCTNTNAWITTNPNVFRLFLQWRQFCKNHTFSNKEKSKYCLRTIMNNLVLLWESCIWKMRYFVDVLICSPHISHNNGHVTFVPTHIL